MANVLQAEEELFRVSPILEEHEAMLYQQIVEAAVQPIQVEEQPLLDQLSNQHTITALGETLNKCNRITIIQTTPLIEIGVANKIAPLILIEQITQGAVRLMAEVTAEELELIRHRQLAQEVTEGPAAETNLQHLFVYV